MYSSRIFELVGLKACDHSSLAWIALCVLCYVSCHFKIIAQADKTIAKLEFKFLQQLKIKFYSPLPFFVTGRASKITG